MERVSTGISGLDSVMEGYPLGRSILVSGKSGTGKTILALQFVRSVCAAGGKVNFISVKEKRDDLIIQAALFGWGFEELENRGLLRIMQLMDGRQADAQFSTYPHDVSFAPIVEAVEDNADVVVIDNLGVLAVDMTAAYFRQQLEYLLSALALRGVTSMIVIDESTLLKFGEVAESVFDGVVKLGKRDNPFTDNRERVLEISKMRNTEHPINYLKFRISPKGIVLDMHQSSLA